MNCVLLEPITEVITYIPLNYEVFELRKICSTKLLMSTLGCGYFTRNMKKENSLVDTLGAKLSSVGTRPAF